MKVYEAPDTSSCPLDLEIHFLVGGTMEGYTVNHTNPFQQGSSYYEEDGDE